MPQPTHDDSKAVGPTTAQVLLGWFVVWQLLFLIGLNGLHLFAPDAPAAGGAETDDPAPAVLGKEHVGDAAELAKGIFGRWAEATGQRQGWAQFTPRAPRHAAFLAVDARWSKEQVERWHSFAEPEDMRAFCRFFPPKGRAKFEQNINCCVADWSMEAIAREPKAWRQHLTDSLRRDFKPVRGFLAWRLGSWQRDHPDRAPPAELVLVVRLYGIPPPDQAEWMWTGPDEVPLARWRMDVAPPAERMPLEYFDTQTGKFEWLPKGK